ncbi:hypothetical protein JCM10207_006478 [Rhodosporidiobolus poonsookiae]
MRPLRMKETASGDEAVRRAQHRAERKSRKKRRKDESLTPPRSRSAAGGPAADDWGPDESALPPEQAYKRTQTDDEFYEALADAERQDQGVGYHEEELYSRQMPAYSTHYSSAASAAAGIEPRSRSGFLAQMDEEEYAEYIRAGVWRMKNKEEVERMERIAKEKKEREERERRDKDKMDREERERIRKLEERRKRKSKEEEEGARARYEEAWKKLQQPAVSPSSAPPATSSSTSTTANSSSSSTSASSAQPYALRFTDFAWPIFPPMAFPPLSWPTVEDLTAPAISTFLLPDALPAEKHKQVLRQAVLAYHPDRFERLVGRIPEEKEDVRERVKELGLRVSQVLNELIKQRK